MTSGFIIILAKVELLSCSGVYFLYEQGENSDHGNGIKPRIVRIDTPRKVI